jgi:hypothetical protein
MPQESIQNGEAKGIEWDPGYSGERGAPIEKRLGSSVSPTSIALALGTGALLFFCQAFLRRLTERFGEVSADYVADRLRDLGPRIDKPQLSRNLLSVRPRSGIRNLPSPVVRRDKRSAPKPGAAGTMGPVSEGDSLVYSVVVLSISRLTRRRRP